jgi:hypothetical protein
MYTYTMGRRLTQEDFLRKSREKHGDKYDYSKSVYTGAGKKILIICPIHGEFEQQAGSHYNAGCGCNDCGIESNRAKMRKGPEYFLEKAREAHGDTYDYPDFLDVVIDNKSSFTVVCEVHGEFTQKVADHVAGKGCDPCAIAKRGLACRHTEEDFIRNATALHGDTYDYSEVKWDDPDDDVVIICKIHGRFPQNRSSHLMGRGCPPCGDIRTRDAKRLTHEIFLERAQAIHKNRYTYDDGVYKEYHKPITITCRVHGNFDQRVADHLSGKGCRSCGTKNLSETMCRKIFQTHLGQSMPSRRHTWLEGLETDGFNDALKLAFEYNGRQHYEFISGWHADMPHFEDQRQRDFKKRTILRSKGYYLIEIDGREYDHKEPELLEDHIVGRLKEYYEWAADQKEADDSE